MTRAQKRTYEPRLRGHRLRVYGQVMAKERQALFVDPERLKWILERYPPEQEWGRDFVPLPIQKTSNEEA